LDELFPPILIGSLVLLALAVIALGGLAWSTRQELDEARQDHAVLLHKLDQILKK
jgi:cell division septation protein DedD